MQKNENAVSPIVGVMLMLVVTIIIAAVVAAFATGIMPNSASGASEAMIEVVGFSDDYKMTTVTINGKDYQRMLGDIGFVFKVTGGSVDLKDLRMAIQGLAWGSAGAMLLTYDDPVASTWLYPFQGGTASSGKGNSRILSNVTIDTNTRMVKYGAGLSAEDLSDTIVESGEMFLVRVEYYVPAANSMSIGVAALRDGNTWASGAIALTPGQAAYLTLSNAKTGVTYVDAMLTEDDII